MKDSETRFILASSSPRRLSVLRQLGLNPGVRPAEIDESYACGESPSEYVERLARSKAEAVAATEQNALVVAGDTVVLYKGQVLVKARDSVEAVSMLSQLAGNIHEVLTGLAIAGSHGIVSDVERTEVLFRDFGTDTIRRYASTGEPLDKAGAYGIQGLGAALVAGVQGDYYSVVGFPVSLFLDLLEQAGWLYNFGHLSQISSEV